MNKCSLLRHANSAHNAVPFFFSVKCFVNTHGLHGEHLAFSTMLDGKYNALTSHLFFDLQSGAQN